jgi:anion-transporting  ArsA/GET3 family ATPase
LGVDKAIYIHSSCFITESWRSKIICTAPTGHTILLLDAAEAYHREVLRTTTQTPEAVRQLLPRLRDPGYTQILLVTLPEATPVLEAQRLQNDLRRAGIEPYGWVINQSLLGASPADPLLLARAAAEREFIDKVVGQLSTRCALIPWVATEPVGADALRRLARSWTPLHLAAEQGLPIGTVLAFMMAVTALSLPELIILRRVLKPQLLTIFVGVMTVTNIGVGYLFNAVT